MQLVIAEKPSVARDLARVLGATRKGDGCLEGAQHVVTWCVGHLLELEEPGAYEPGWKRWSMDALPMIPSRFTLRAVPSGRGQLASVRKLLRNKRFDAVVNACDAGREGELIFRWVYEHAGARLPVRRLCISSLTDASIRAGFAALQPGARYDPLADAARCRAELVPRGWISNERFLAGYGAAQALPGPLFTFAAYLGAAMRPGHGAWARGLWSLLAIFLPAWLLVGGALPFWHRLRAIRAARAALGGANAAVVGVLLAALYDPVFTEAVRRREDLVAALLAFGLLVHWRAPPWAVVLVMAAAGQWVLPGA